jgi:hypothetical protein
LKRTHPTNQNVKEKVCSFLEEGERRVCRRPFFKKKILPFFFFFFLVFFLKEGILSSKNKCRATGHEGMRKRNLG